MKEKFENFSLAQFFKRGHLLLVITKHIFCCLDISIPKDAKQI